MHKTSMFKFLIFVLVWIKKGAEVGKWYTYTLYTIFSRISLQFHPKMLLPCIE